MSRALRNTCSVWDKRCCVARKHATAATCSSENTVPAWLCLYTQSLLLLIGGRLQVRGHLAVLLACLYVRSAAAQGGANVARMSPSAAELAAFRADLKVAFIADDGGPGTSAGGVNRHDCFSVHPVLVRSSKST